MARQEIVKRLPIGLIVADPKYQIREGLDPQTVRKYQETYSKTPKRIPPLKVALINGKYYLVDGFHRLQAAIHAGMQEIEVEICLDNETDAMWIALGANHDHGLLMTPKDKKKAILIALKEFPNYSFAMIAEQIDNKFMVSLILNKVYGIPEGKKFRSLQLFACTFQAK